jgi:hypothetical protein
MMVRFSGIQIGRVLPDPFSLSLTSIIIFASLGIEGWNVETVIYVDVGSEKYSRPTYCIFHELSALMCQNRSEHLVGT